MQRITSNKLILAILALTFATGAARADDLVYTVNLFQQFGTVNTATGSFNPIGPGLPEGGVGLIPATGGSLLNLAFSGNLYAINPSTGLSTLVGATGLSDCTTPASPCGPKSANTIGGLNGKVYATDFNNNLYIVDSTTGAATLIGSTGIPPVSMIPFTTTGDGSTYLFDETLFGHNGNLYATFDDFTLQPDGFTKTFLNSSFLYQIDPTTGASIVISAAASQILSAVDIGGTVYAFQGGLDAANPFPGFEQFVSLDTTNGKASFISSTDPSAGPIFGIAPVVPEPASLALVGTGLAAMAAGWKKVTQRRRTE
jgi:hypothetical protein